MPKTPKKAEEADKDKAGKVAEVQPLKGEDGQYDLGEQEVEKPGTEEETEEETSSHFVKIKLQDKNGDPISKKPSGGPVKFHTKAGDQVYEGQLNEQGQATVEGLPESQCEISFPEIESKEWKKK